MRTAAECLARAQALEALAADEADGWRRQAYLQMAAYWRESAALKPEDANPDPAPDPAPEPDPPPPPGSSPPGRDR